MNSEAKDSTESPKSQPEQPLNLKLFRSLSNQATQVPIIFPPSSPLPSGIEFSRLVHHNTPVLMKGTAKDWPCMRKWSSRSYLSAKIRNPIEVAQTPDGRADAVNESTSSFLLPHTTRMSIDAFFATLDKSSTCTEPKKSNCIISYVQSQNDNMHGDFTPLLDDIPGEIGFVSEALGRSPDAINFWMGNKASKTSLHKDPYENLVIVVKGVKVFTLIPPTDFPWLYEQTWPTLQCHLTPQGLWDPPTSLDPPITTPWIPIDPDNPDLLTYPLYAHAHPFKIRVEEGDMLYLPSLWYHHVAQESNPSLGGCISINYWYDMDYGPSFHYFRFLRGLVLGGSADDDDEEED